MTKREKIHLSIASFINMLIVGLMAYVVINSSSDKSPVIFILYAPLILLNAIIWLILYLFKQEVWKIYMLTTLGLILSFIPVVLVTVLFLDAIF